MQETFVWLRLLIQAGLQVVFCFWNILSIGPPYYNGNPASAALHFKEALATAHVALLVVSWSVKKTIFAVEHTRMQHQRGTQKAETPRAERSWRIAIPTQTKEEKREGIMNI